MAQIIPRKKGGPSRRPPRPAALPVKRRKPGGTWHLWAVQLEGGCGLHPVRETCGFLLMDGAHCPAPLAYIAPIGRIKIGGPIKALELARAIRDGLVKPGARGSIDLSGDDWFVTHRELVGKTLIPLDEAGRYIGKRGRWAAGYFVTPNEAAWMGGRGMAASGPPAWCMMVREMAFPNEQEKSGSPEKPLTLAPASKKDNEARLLTAA